MKFVLEIELGNDAMRTVSDVARAGRSAFENLRVEFDGGKVTTDSNGNPISRRIRDINGNTVGRWEVKP